MYKKVLSLMAVLALTVGVFAGCNKDKDKEKTDAAKETTNVADMDALIDALEVATTNYGGVADVVAESGSVGQKEELEEAKTRLDEIAAEAEKELTAEEAASLTAELAELTETIENIGEAAKGNNPDNTPVTEEDLSNKFETVATLLSGVYENVAANGTVLQQQIITDAQEQLTEMQAGLDAGTYTAEDVMEALEFIEGVAQTVNDDTTPTVTEGRNVNDELEKLATLVSGADANISAGDDQIKKDYMKVIKDTLEVYTQSAANGELDEAATADILEGVDVLTELVKSLNK